VTDLMTVEEIAEMWRCSARHARDCLVKQPGFPAPAPGSGKKHRVWLRSEVRAFAQRKPARIPHAPLQAA
jgi:MarR-like DNA-binding transcriptional regulator SgrR of sgrS sRNA